MPETRCLACRPLSKMWTGFGSFNTGVLWYDPVKGRYHGLGVIVPERNPDSGPCYWRFTFFDPSRGPGIRVGRFSHSGDATAAVERILTERGYDLDSD